MNPYAYSVLAFGFCSFLVGLFVWLRLDSKVAFRFFMFSASAGFWGMTMGLVFMDDARYETALLCARIAKSIAGMIPATWFHFANTFVGPKAVVRNKKMLIFLYLVSGFIFMNMLSPSFIPSLRPIMNFRYFSVPGWIYHVLTTHFFAGVILGFYVLFLHFSKLQGQARKSCQSMIAATMAGFLGGSLTFLPVYGIQLPQYGMFIMPLYPILMAVAMMRYDLFNVHNFAMAAHKNKLAALGILTASINHEIRAPLFVIRGTIEAQSENEKVKTTILSQIDRLTGIVSRLTHFAKKGVEETAQIESLDLKEVLTDIRPLFQYQLNYQNIEYTQDIPNDLPKLMADRRYLEEILFNLILNACQALKNSPHPKITLTGSVLGTKSRGLTPMIPPDSRFTNYAVRSTSSIAIAIADNGPGIASDQQKNIFKPFHTTKSEGTGLGLYITKQLVEKCGGRIHVQSELSKGAQFSVHLKMQ